MNLSSTMVFSAVPFLLVYFSAVNSDASEVSVVASGSVAPADFAEVMEKDSPVAGSLV